VQPRRGGQVAASWPGRPGRLLARRRRRLAPGPAASEPPDAALAQHGTACRPVPHRPPTHPSQPPPPSTPPGSCWALAAPRPPPPQSPGWSPPGPAGRSCPPAGRGPRRRAGACHAAASAPLGACHAAASAPLAVTQARRVGGGRRYPPRWRRRGAGHGWRGAVLRLGRRARAVAGPGRRAHEALVNAVGAGDAVLVHRDHLGDGRASACGRRQRAGWTLAGWADKAVLPCCWPRSGVTAGPSPPPTPHPHPLALPLSQARPAAARHFGARCRSPGSVESEARM
jgi:hypothetical protein